MRLYLEVALQCNLRCPSCFHAYLDPQLHDERTNFMTPFLFERIAAALFPGALMVWYNGNGESLLHPSKVRQAIQAAIKQEEFIEIVRSGFGLTMTGPIPTYRKPWALPASARPEFDAKKAKRLLTEAGYAQGFETELIVGSPGDNVKSAQVVKDQLAKVGIQVTWKPMEMAQY